MENLVKILIYKIILLNTCSSTQPWGYDNRNFVVNEDDTKLNFTGLAYKYGTTPAEYDVVTTDGYVLKLFRIPGKGKSILLQHGFQDSADTFIIRGYGSLAITLAANGYDVWVGNIRGNKYSRRHQSLNPDIDDKFWDFSLHEHGYYDLPAMIDFILYSAGRRKLDYIGHSQGTSIALILGSTRPEYNQKIGLYIALAPVAFLQNVSLALKLFFLKANNIDCALKFLRKEELCAPNSFETLLVKKKCADPVKGIVCLTSTFALTGFNYAEMEPSFLPVYYSHFPSGSSRKNMHHFAQIGITGNFANYNYGDLNYAKYGTRVPPLYDLSKVTMPTVLIVSKNDGFSSVEDTNRLKASLPNVIEYMIVENPMFNHLDFVQGRTSYRTFYPKILVMLQQYSLC